MLRLMTMLVLAVLFLAPAGCVYLQPTDDNPFAEFPFRHDRFDFETAWRAVPSQQGLAVDVVLKNVRFLKVEDLELNVSLQRQGKVVAQESAFLPGSLNDGDYCNLSVVLKNQIPSSGDRLHFRVKYSGIEGSVAHMLIGNFTVDAVTGAVMQGKEFW